jgi:hypothetical protein
MKKLIALIVLVCACGHAEGKARLVLVAPRSDLIVGRPLSLDVYLHNEGKQSIKVAPLRFASASWSVLDPTGRRSAEAGSSQAVSDHGAERLVVRAGTVAHEKITVYVSAHSGDIVRVVARLGNGHHFESNPVTVNVQGSK